MEEKFILVFNHNKRSMKQQELAEQSQFFQRVLKMDNFCQNAEFGSKIQKNMQKSILQPH